MQTLDVISVNLWQMLASFANLVLLFLIVKKFLYQPIKKVLNQRRSEIDRDYEDAAKAREEALLRQREYEEKLKGASSEADRILKNAVDTASFREREILEEAKEKAEGILERARADAKLEEKKAMGTIRERIVEVSTLLSEKMLEREVDPRDHQDLIDSFIDGIGEENEGN